MQPENNTTAPEEIRPETEEAATDPLLERLAELEAQSAENLDGWQRAVAELANARKRFERQRGEMRARTTIDVVETFLPLIDDLALATANVPDHISADEWYKGFALIPRKLKAILETLRIEPIAAVGQPFDPHFHNAISTEPNDTYPAGTVIREYQTGYRVGNDVIRTAVVAVAA
jgi:molecular chaperone GrpE